MEISVKINDNINNKSMGRGASFETINTGPRRDSLSLPIREKVLWREEVLNAKEREEKQVMIDIDNTLFPLLDGLRAIEPGIRGLDLSHDEKSLREELKDLGFDLDLLLEDLYHNQEIMNSVGTFADAEKILSTLKEHGIKLHIVSKRPESSRKVLEEFLASSGIPYDVLSLGVFDKLSYLEDNQITTLVDDDPNLIQEAESRGRDAISFDWKHSERALREHGGQEASSWEDIGHHVLDAVSTNIKRRHLRESEDPNSLLTKERDKSFMMQASLAGHSGTCLRRRVGAVIVDADGILIEEGSNQAPTGASTCEESGCLTDDAGRCQRTMHAESNAIMKASPGALAGATLYCTDRPCLGCAKIIASSGIRRVVYARPYHAESFEVEELFSALDIEIMEISTSHDELNLPPSGPRDGMKKPEDQVIKKTKK